MNKRMGLVLFLLILACGCVSDTQVRQEMVRLSEPPSLPQTMKHRHDLLDISDCRLVFDLSDIPVEIGMPLVVYNPFDDRSPRRSRTAVVPIRKVLLEVWEDGQKKAFLGNPLGGEATLRPVLHRIGMNRQGMNVRMFITCSVYLNDLKLGEFSAERISPWGNEQDIPLCVYEAAADIGNQFFDAIASSSRAKDQLMVAQREKGKAPTIESCELSDLAESGFSGEMAVNAGSWPLGKVYLWAQTQIEQIAIAKLGVRQLDRHRIVLLHPAGHSWKGDRISIQFRVVPYTGFEISSYDPETRRGVCSVDLVYLGLSETDAYRKAIQFIESILSDQGIVKIAGQESPAARYRLLGYSSTHNGTRLEIPFELID